MTSQIGPVYDAGVSVGNRRTRRLVDKPTPKSQMAKAGTANLASCFRSTPVEKRLRRSDGTSMDVEASFPQPRPQRVHTRTGFLHLAQPVIPNPLWRGRFPTRRCRAYVSAGCSVREWSADSPERRFPRGPVGTRPYRRSQQIDPRARPVPTQTRRPREHHRSRCTRSRRAVLRRLG